MNKRQGCWCVKSIKCSNHYSCYGERDGGSEGKQHCNELEVAGLFFIKTQHLAHSHSHTPALGQWEPRHSTP